MREKSISFRITHFEKKLMKIIEFFENVYYTSIPIVIYLFLIAGFLILLLKTISTGNFKDLIEIAQIGIILTATLAILTFTYALTFDDYKKKPVIYAGKYFFLSCLNFMIGIILLTGFGEAFKHATEYNDVLRSVINGIFLIISFIILVLSAAYFASGIKDLLKILTK